MGYEPLQGNALLRRQIAKRCVLWNGTLAEEDLVTTAGCMNALAFSLMVIARPGDAIAVESPVYFGLLQLAKNMHLQVIELPTSSDQGIDLDSLKHLLRTKRIAGCVLISNFSNPCGYTMPAEHKKLLVELLTFYNVPLVEDDLYADVYFGDKRPASCKAFDQAGIVFWCGSVSKTLALATG